MKTTTGCISVSAFTSILFIPLEITSSAIGLKICAITAIIKKKKMQYDKIVLLAKSKLNSIEVLISKTLMDSVIDHNKFVFISDVLRI